LNGIAPKPQAEPKTKAAVAKGELALAVAEVVETMPTEFDTLMVIRAIETRGGPEAPRTSISHALARLAEDGQLVVIDRGKGRRPTKYTRRAPGKNPGASTNGEHKPATAGATRQ
jgi:hypothetical protein